MGADSRVASAPPSQAGVQEDEVLTGILRRDDLHLDPFWLGTWDLRLRAACRCRPVTMRAISVSRAVLGNLEPYNP